MYSPSSECANQVKDFHTKTEKTSLLLFAFCNATFVIFGNSHLCGLEYKLGFIIYFDTFCMTLKPASADLALFPLKLRGTLRSSVMND